MRQEIRLNENWRFHRGDIDLPRSSYKGPIYSCAKTERALTGPASYTYPDRPDPFWSRGSDAHERWERVELPHDYVIEGEFDRNENNALGYLPYDNAWYRRHFKLPEGTAEGARVLLRFDGVSGESTVYLNGCLVGRNYSTYNSFEIDISDYVYFDRENVVAVYVDQGQFEGWWYAGGGIYRDVWLTVTDAVAIPTDGVFAPARRLDAHLWQIDFETEVVNTGYVEAEAIAVSEIVDASGTVIAVAEGAGKLSARGETKLSYAAVVADPALWDTEHPNLYTVRTSLRSGEMSDESVTRIGFRTVEISPEQGLLLNGEPTIIKGVCAHQDFGLTGLAVPDNVQKYKMKLIREMGANGFRTAHYQHPTATMDALDELGFLVMDEARWFDSTPEGLAQVTALVKRDRNRPSVIFWSTGNEEPSFVTDRGRRIHRALAAHIRSLDPTRAVTAAEDKSPDQSTIYGDCDVIGINYNLDLYDKVHELYPNRAVFASECCATGTTRDWQYPSEQGGRLRDRDADTNVWFRGREHTWKHLMARRPWVLGGYQWAAVEHRGEAAWPALCSKSGAIDLFLQKKGAFYQNQSHWTDAPMVHIVPHWNFRGLECRPLSVVVYTNCEEVELWQNGVSQGRRAIELYGHGEWEVRYVPGRLEAVAYRGGREVVRDIRETTGRAERLRLTPLNAYEANGRDLALFLCECLDADGRAVPDAAEFVRFSVSSPAVIVGTGSDHCDHSPIALPERQMYMGKILIAVKPANGHPSFTLTAFSNRCGVTQVSV